MTKRKSKLFRYEYEMAENGAILADLEIPTVYVSTDEHNEKVKMMGEELFGIIDFFLKEKETCAARITIKIEAIKPKY